VHREQEQDHPSSSQIILSLQSAANAEKYFQSELSSWGRRKRAVDSLAGRLFVLALIALRPWDNSSRRVVPRLRGASRRLVVDLIRNFIPKCGCLASPAGKRSVRSRCISRSPWRRVALGIDRLDSTFASRLCVRADCESRRDPTRPTLAPFLSLQQSFHPPPLHDVAASTPKTRSLEPAKQHKPCKRLFRARGYVPRVANEAKAPRDTKGVQLPRLALPCPRFGAERY